jgi:hypothetical protein
MGDKNVWTILVGETEDRNNIKMNVKEIGYEVLNCVMMTQSRMHWQAFVNTVTNFKFYESGVE